MKPLPQYPRYVKGLVGPHRPAFALIISIALMAFILLLLLSLTAIVQVEMQSASLMESQSKARLNARYAVMTAIGSIQKLTGPDQRVTASADILTSTGPYAVDRSDDKRHWVGVWSTENYNADGSDQTRGRNAGEVGDYASAFQGWLVSGDGLSVDTATEVGIEVDLADYAGPEQVTLLGDGSAYFQDTADTARDGVRLPKVGIESDEGQVGSYAYWVSDESSKATVNLEDPHEGAASASLKRRYGQAFAARPNAEYGMQAVSDALSLAFTPVDVDSNLLKSLQSMGQFPLLASSVAKQPLLDEIRRGSFHDLSPHSLSVLSDVRNGGLRDDLSLAMEISDADFQKTNLINSTDVNRVGSWKQTLGGSDLEIGYLFKEETTETIRGNDLLLRGPSWQLLRSFYRTYRSIDNRLTKPIVAATANRPNLRDTSEMEMYEAIPFQSHKNGVGHAYGWPNSHFTMLKKTRHVVRNTQTQRVPIVTRAKYLYGVQRVSVGGEKVLSFSLNFVATIMNPYNVAIEFQGYQLMLHALPATIMIEKYAPTELIPSAGAIEVELENDADYGPYNLEYVLRREVDGMKLHKDAGDIVLGEMSEPIFANYILTEVDGSGNAITDGSARIRLEPGEVKVISLANDDYKLDPEIGLPATFTYNDQGGFRYTQLGHGDQFLAYTPAKTKWPRNTPGPEADDPSEVPLNPLDPLNPYRPDGLIPLNDDDRIVIKFTAKINTRWKDYGLHYDEDPRVSDPGPGSREPNREGKIFFNQFLLDGSGDLATALSHFEAPREWWTQSMRLNMYNKHTLFDFDTSQVYTGSELDTQRFIGSTDILLKAVDETYTPGPYLANFNLRQISGRDNSTMNLPERMGPPMYHVVNESLVATAVNYPIKGGAAYNGAWGSSNSSAGESRVILFEAPTAPMTSLGSFQHADIGMMPDQPTYAVGNSFAQPFIPRDQLWAKYVNSNKEWIFADFSYLANEALWDSSFFSTLTAMDAFTSASSPSESSIQAALDDEIEGFVRGTSELPNPNFKSVPRSESDAAAVIAEIQDPEAGLNKVAANAMLRGGFNVNSTSVAAWKAMLTGLVADGTLDHTNGSGTVMTASESAPALFTRYTLPGGGSGEDWVGIHALDDAQVTELAEAIVAEVKARGPFISVADFVNRRLVTGDAGLRGTLQAAIDNRTTINQNNLTDLSSVATDPLGAAGKTPYPEMSNLLDQSGIGAPAYLMQSDILTAIGPSLTARSDTFVIRAYGDRTNPVTGVVEAQAWCEAVVQRVPDFVEPALDEPYAELYDPSGNPALNSSMNQRYGRQYKVISFRWLNPNDV